MLRSRYIKGSLVFQFCRCLSNVAIAEYPEIKPKFPPGRWSENMPENVCWEIYEEGNNIKQIPTVKERLERFAGSEQKWMVDLTGFDSSPDTLDYKQYMTKTHIINSLPTLYEAVSVDNIYDRLKPSILRSLAQSFYFWENNSLHSNDLIDPKIKNNHVKSCRFIGNFVNTLIPFLSASISSLQRSQVDENVRVETWFKRYGFSGDDKPVKDKWHDLATVQYKDYANYQIRTEQPISEFLPHDHQLCVEGFYPQIDYAPMAIGQHESLGRPITVSGHWHGDPCEFNLVSFYIMPPSVQSVLTEFGHQYVEEGTLVAGLVSSFGSCLAQAHNQGFNWIFDVTYPFTAQTIVVRDNWFRLCCYQLNTTHLWKDDAVNPLRNILWVSEEKKLFESVSSDGKIEGFNDELCKTLLKFFMMPTSDRGGINLRPYLPNEKSPRETHLYINNVGSEPLPYKKIDRYQYPKNAVYF